MAKKAPPVRKKKTKIKPAPQAAKFVLRIPPALHAQIKKKAAENYQSMNEYITQGMAVCVNPKNQLADLIKRLEEKGVID